jgi:hypothetical protein
MYLEYLPILLEYLLILLENLPMVQEPAGDCTNAL